MTVELLDAPEVELDERDVGVEEGEERLEIHDREGCEYINGEWVKKVTSAKSDRVGLNLAEILGPYVRQKELGLTFGPECGYQIFGEQPKRLRKPDISFVRAELVPGGMVPDGNLTVVPDLAVEIVSPREEAIKLNGKLVEYLQVGIKLVWVVYPHTRFVEIFRSDGSANWVLSGKLTGENVIPGFEIPFDSLFRGA